jgi:exopolysaccharide biosynthesis protein
MWREQLFDLPSSIRVYEGTARAAGGQAFRAWRVDVDFSDRTLKAQPFLADDPSGRALPSVQAQRVDALVAVNGGYFDMDSVPAKTYSLVMRDGQVLCSNVNRVRRGRRTYFVARSAFGVTQNHKFDISWIVHDGDKVLALKQPFSQTVGEAETPVVENAREWKVQNAIGGGPRLLENGRESITYDEEVFFGSGFPSEQNYSRCAVGYKPNGTMVFLVTDRMDPRISAGLTLHGTAQTLLQLGCKDAMNLDGGGSETLVVNGRVLNQPSDGQ